ncbi:DddA-like double-stranded DNA deaminase toxin [Allokutzneria sp. NRRL B-24872]|uniref:DddA-like double-stranded DNA deaminase toxin n=1 Tax=Allokutzneria sp. NRRL B-24872 TaxID=1137961 RepID=UPI000A382098|nr:DddA-like double-stranded DNA deaminase toxin [Allokutzneria sp. NRRL B-24872]
MNRTREQLPPTVAPKSGAKTHGRWTVDGEVANVIVSGRDSDADLADQLLAERGLPGRASRSADVEMKLAARMATGGPRHVTVLINNRPCRGPFGCDTLVPVLLPAGSTLTVLGNDGYRKTFEGGATPWWS